MQYEVKVPFCFCFCKRFTNPLGISYSISICISTLHIIITGFCYIEENVFFLGGLMNQPIQWIMKILIMGIF